MMMFGMFGFGLLALLLLVGLPVLLLVLLFGGTGFLRTTNHPTYSQQTNQPGFVPVTQTSKPVEEPSRNCTHCGVALQSNWSHCPHCGAPVQPKS